MMEKELNVKQLQLEMGNKIKEELSRYFFKIDIGYVNLDYSVSKGYVFYIYNYINEYDYAIINTNFVVGATPEYYVDFIINCIEENKNLVEHFASPEEKFILDVLGKNKVKNLYVFEGELYSKNDYEGIDLSSVDYIAFDKINNILVIYSDEEQFEINLTDETINWLTEPDYEDETADYDREESGEIIDNDFLHTLCNKWNQLQGIWGILLYEDECLKIKDIKNENINELVALDDINFIKFNKEKKEIFVGYDNADDENFTSFKLTKDGIEY